MSSHPHPRPAKVRPMKIDLVLITIIEGVEEEGANQKPNFKVPLAMTKRHKTTLLYNRKVSRVTTKLVSKSPPIDVSTLTAPERAAAVGRDELNQSFPNKLLRN